MPLFLNYIFSSNTKINPERVVQKDQTPTKEIHNAISSVASKAIKDLSKVNDENERFILTVKDTTEQSSLKNERNIMLYILECDFNKEKVKSSDIKVAVNYCVKRAAAGQLSEIERKQIVAFFDKVSSLPKETFNRPALLGGHLSLQKLLSPELSELLEAQEKDNALKNNTQHQLNISIAKAKLSIQLGFGVSNAGNGANGAQIVRDLENKPVGVFKARPEIKWYQFSEHMKKYFGQARLLNQTGLNQQYAEVAAYQFDEIMGFKLAPAATMVELKNKEGAFLAFLGGFKELKDCETALESRQSYDKEERIKWQKMCLGNFIKANLDPHNENIFVRLDNDNKLTDIRMIDHGNCFVEHNPGKWGSKGNLGKYGEYKISSCDFEPEILEFIRTSLTEKNLDQFITQIGLDRKSFWNIHMDQLQRDRIRLLRECVLNGSIKNPAQLAKVQTQEDYNSYLKNGVQRQEIREETDVGGFSVLDINE